MESTIYRAAVTLFVEGAGVGWILPAVIALVAGLGGSLIGAWATRKAAKEGAKEAHDYSRQLEEDRVQVDGKTSLTLLYVELGKNAALFSGVLDSLKNLAVNNKLKEFDFYVRHEDIHNVAKLDVQLGFSAALCQKWLYRYQDYAAEYNKTTFSDEEAKERDRMYAEHDIKLFRANYYLKYKKIEKYYKEHVVSKLENHPLAAGFDCREIAEPLLG